VLPAAGPFHEPYRELAGPNTSTLPRGRRAIALRASDVVREQVSWLLPGRIPYGELTILAGDPGLGKSLLAVSLVARVTRGELGKAGDALMLTAEDSPEHTVRPRLDAAGTLLDRVRFGLIERDGLPTPFMLPTEVGELRTIVAERETALVVIDPLTAHLAGNVNSWKDQEVRTALAPLSGLAKETGAAIVIVAHLNKGQSEDPLQRLGGSIGIPAAARSVLLLARDPDDPDGEQGSRRVLAHVKSNLGPLAPSVRYQIEPAMVDDGFADAVETARISEQGEVAYTGAELLAAPRPERGAKLQEAIAFLKAELTSGERPVREVERAATQLGIREQTLRRAKDELRITSHRLDRGWAWALPPSTGDSGDAR
jgi:putative DNA primase/helicase